MKSIKIAALAVLVTALFSAGCGKTEDHDTMEQPRSEKQIDSTNIHPADTQVADLDKNKDDKVFQCPMHGSVIADDKTTCPICKMDLEEVAVQTAQENLHINTDH